MSEIFSHGHLCWFFFSMHMWSSGIQRTGSREGTVQSGMLDKETRCFPSPVKARSARRHSRSSRSESWVHRLIGSSSKRTAYDVQFLVGMQHFQCLILDVLAGMCSSLCSPGSSQAISRPESPESPLNSLSTSTNITMENHHFSWENLL